MRPILLPELGNDTLVQIQVWLLENLPAYARGAVLGMSGGIDSSVVAGLTAKAFQYHQTLGGWPLALYGYALPTKLNSPDDVKDARRVAEQFQIPFEVFDLDPATTGMEAVFGNGTGEHHLSAYDRGNMISRIRANVLWTLAATHESIVMGTGKRDEDYGVGYRTLLGDGAVYMNPIGILSKRLVREAGACLKLPDDLVKRTPAAGLEPNQTDATDLGYPYEFVELVIEGIDQGFSLWDLTRHPQIRVYEHVLTGLGKFRADVSAAIFDVLHRHDLAKRKAQYLNAKVPNIKLQRVLRVTLDADGRGKTNGVKW